MIVTFILQVDILSFKYNLIQLYMTPAINKLKATKTKYILHKYEHLQSSKSYGEEAADKLGLPHSQVFKTLVVTDENKNLFVCIVPVNFQLDIKILAQHLQKKKILLAPPKIVENNTGYILGGVSPIGQKRTLPTFIDKSATDFNTIFISAGRRGLEIEIAPQDLQTLINGTFLDLSRIK